MFRLLLGVLGVGVGAAASPAGSVFEVTDDAYTTGKDTVTLKVGHHDNFPLSPGVAHSPPSCGGVHHVRPLTAGVNVGCGPWGVGGVVVVGHGDGQVLRNTKTGEWASVIPSAGGGVDDLHLLAPGNQLGGGTKTPTQVLW